MTPIQISIPNEVIHENKTGLKKTGLALFSIGLLIFLISFTSASEISPVFFFIFSIGLGSLGALIFFYGQYQNNLIAGVKKNRTMFLDATNKGLLGWATAVFFTSGFRISHSEYFADIERTGFLLFLFLAIEI